jgi:hypothetical protein
MAYEHAHDQGGRASRRVRYAVLAGILTAVAAIAPLEPTFASKQFVRGNATAIAQAVQIAPRTGGLSAAVSLGTTIAQYRDSLAQASSQAIDLGVIGTTLTVSCDSTPPAVKPSQLPQPLVAESTDGNAHATKNTAGQGSAGFAAVAGHEAVEALTTPTAIASYDGTSLVIPNLITATGLHTEGHSTLVPGKARIATAMSQIGQLKLLNAIVLDGLKWTATDRSGTKPSRSSSFSIGGISIAGHALPASQAQAESTITSVNKLIAFTGLHITLPHRQYQGGILTETPLVIGIDDSKLGGQVVNPVLGAVTPATNALRDALDKISCSFGKLFTVVDLATAALDGTGGVDLKLGGTSATTDGRTYANPFGNGSTLGRNPSLGGNQSTSPSGGGGISPGSNLGGGNSSVVPPLGSSTQTTTPSDTAPLVSGTKVVSSSCSTTSPANRPSCSQGEGLMVGLIAIAAVAAIAGADYLVMRRKRKLPAVAL